MKRKESPVYAILLAAGESKRCPENKLFLPWGKTTVLQAAVENLLQSRVDQTAVILGYQAAKARDLLREMPCSPVTNENYRRGMGTSVIKGVSHWRRHPDLSAEAGFLLALGDEPFIGREIIDKVISAWRNTEKGIVLPVFEGCRGHPAIFHRRYADEIIEVCRDVGAREVLKRHPEDILAVEIDTDAILLDIDTEEDYRKLCKRFNP